MTDTSVFDVPRRTGSPADVLEAIGAAFLVQHLSDVAPERVRIVARNGGFEIAVRGATAPARPLTPLIPYFLDAKGEAPKARRGEIYDYATDKRRSDEGKAAAKQRGGKPRGKRKRSDASRDVVTEEQEDRAKTSPRWPLFSSLQALTKGQFQNDWNKIWRFIDELTDKDAMSSAVFAWEQLRSTATAQSAIASNHDDELTLVQYLNPTAAKGANRAKAGSTNRVNVSGSRFHEWLKAIGLERTAILRRVGEDVRLWVPVPGDVGLEALQAMLVKFGETPWRMGDIKQDLLVTLDLSDALARHWIARRQPPRRRASRVVRGVETVSFKNMGGGFNVMNVTTYGLPGWIVLEDERDLESYLEALDAFRRAAYSLDESHSDEISVLASMREALGAETSRPMLAFLADYAVFVQRTIAKAADRRTTGYRFASNVLDDVLGGVDGMLTTIVQDQGFRNVATALRKATVTEQWHKREGKQVYEIHYGLFADLRRSARRKTDFVARLAEFVASYNAENARILEAKRERGRPRPRVSDADLDAVLALVEAHGPELIGHLLCAYGSAKEHRESDEERTEQ